MRHSTIRDFCRYLSTSAGFDDRLGVIVFQDFRRAQPWLSLVARRMNATLALYAGNDTEFISTLAKRANCGTPCLVLLECPPGAEFRALLRALARTASRPIPADNSYAREPRLVLAASRTLYFGLPRSDPLRSIGCCLQLDSEVLTLGGDEP